MRIGRPRRRRIANVDKEEWARVAGFAGPSPSGDIFPVGLQKPLPVECPRVRLLCPRLGWHESGLGGRIRHPLVAPGVPPAHLSHASSLVCHCHFGRPLWGLLHPPAAATTDLRKFRSCEELNKYKYFTDTLLLPGDCFRHPVPCLAWESGRCDRRPILGWPGQRSGLRARPKHRGRDRSGRSPRSPGRHRGAAKLKHWHPDAAALHGCLASGVERGNCGGPSTRSAFDNLRGGGPGHGLGPLRGVAGPPADEGQWAESSGGSAALAAALHGDQWDPVAAGRTQTVCVYIPGDGLVVEPPEGTALACQGPGAQTTRKHVPQPGHLECSVRNCQRGDELLSSLALCGVWGTAVVRLFLCGATNGHHRSQVPNSLRHIFVGNFRLRLCLFGGPDSAYDRRLGGAIPSAILRWSGSVLLGGLPYRGLSFEPEAPPGCRILCSGAAHTARTLQLFAIGEWHHRLLLRPWRTLHGVFSTRNFLSSGDEGYPIGGGSAEVFQMVQQRFLIIKTWLSRPLPLLGLCNQVRLLFSYQHIRITIVR